MRPSSGRYRTISVHGAGKHPFLAAPLSPRPTHPLALPPSPFTYTLAWPSTPLLLLPYLSLHHPHRCRLNILLPNTQTQGVSPPPTGPPFSPDNLRRSRDLQSLTAEKTARRRAAADFILRAIGVHVPTDTDLAFRVSLRSGEVLCMLMRAFRPDLIQSIHSEQSMDTSPSHPNPRRGLMEAENVEHFTRACRMIGTSLPFPHLSFLSCNIHYRFTFASYLSIYLSPLPSRFVHLTSQNILTQNCS